MQNVAGQKKEELRHTTSQSVIHAYRLQVCKSVYVHFIQECGEPPRKVISCIYNSKSVQQPHSYFSQLSCICRYLCSDLVYVILFPQLLLVVHWDQGVTTYGCLASYVVGLTLRVLGLFSLYLLPIAQNKDQSVLFYRVNQSNKTMFINFPPNSFLQVIFNLISKATLEKARTSNKYGITYSFFKQLLS